MRVRVKVSGELADYLPQQFEVEIEDGSSLKRLIVTLIASAGIPIHTILCDPKLTTLINGRNILTLEGFTTPLKNDDIVTFTPLVVGG